MRLGLQVSDFTWPGVAPDAFGARFAQLARDAEEAGFASFWTMDHFFQIAMIGPPERAMLEAYTALGFAAGATSRIRLGALVTGVTYRHPGILMKQVTTLDVLSGGRAYLGIGAAWNEEEHRGLGVPFPPLKERFERLEEALRVAHQMLGDGAETPIEGEHYTLERPINAPAPLSRPRVPILIGGSGEKKSLRLVAQYGDACNLFDMGPERIRGKLDVLRGHCDAVGRDYGDIEKTVISSLAFSRDGGESANGQGTKTVEQALDYYGVLAELGVEHVIGNFADPVDPAEMELAAELIPKLEAVVPAGR